MDVFIFIGCLHFYCILLTIHERNTADPDQKPHSVVSEQGLCCLDMYVGEVF